MTNADRNCHGIVMIETLKYGVASLNVHIAGTYDVMHSANTNSHQ